jgi:DNA-directed RNA polymerase subunit RPC12/RpoP
MTTSPATSGVPVEFSCVQCGAKLEFAPGIAAMKCPYCGEETAIGADGKPPVSPSDFLREVQRVGLEQAGEDELVVKCSGCGAETELEPGVVAGRCPFCDSPIVATAVCKRLIQPGSLLPFHITHPRALELFNEWLQGRWFAPRAFCQLSQTETNTLQGVYMPAWTYDCRTLTAYRGERGTAYYVSQSYTVNGKRQTRQVRKIRWTSVSGTVRNTFADLLVLASRSMPDKLARKLEPWDLKKLVPYDDRYLAGFKALAYQVDLVAGFEQAKTMMASPIQTAIRRDIGGDEQRIHSFNVSYLDITYKHLLLPAWVGAYRFDDRVFQFLINARTGEVQGQRPWSWVKITLTAVAAAVVVAVIVYFLTGN